MWSRTRVILLTQIAILIVLIVTATLVSPYFFTTRNLINILRQASLIVIPATGQAVVIISGGFDLSVGAILALSAVVTALLWKLGMPIYLAAICGLLAGLAAGWVNGILVSRVKLPPFVATYGMMFVLMGTSMVLMGGDYIVGFPEEFQFLGKGSAGVGDAQLPMPFVIAIITAAVLDVLMTLTTFGRRVHAVGSNRQAARLSGISVQKVQLAVYMLCGLVAALGGLVVMGRMNAAEMRMGDDFLLPVVAAAVLGGCSLAGGEGSVWGTFVGAIILVTVTNVMTLAGTPDYWRPAVSGAVIIVAVILDLIGRRFLQSRAGGKSKGQPSKAVTAPVTTEPAA